MTHVITISFGDNGESVFGAGKATPINCAFYLGMWILIIVGCIAGVVGFIAPPASAQNMSISDLGYVGAQTIEIYTVDGSLDGTYNTTSTGIVLPDDDFYIIIKPTTANMDVSVLLGNAMTWIAQYWVAIIFAFGAILLLVRKW